MDDNSQSNYNMMNKTYLKIFLSAAFLIITHSAITINSISGVSDNNLVFSGTIPISTSTNLFFTYYGVDGQKDQNALKNFPLLIFVAK